MQELAAKNRRGADQRTRNLRNWTTTLTAGEYSCANLRSPKPAAALKAMLGVVAQAWMSWRKPLASSELGMLAEYLPMLPEQDAPRGILCAKRCAFEIEQYHSQATPWPH